MSDTPRTDAQPPIFAGGRYLVYANFAKKLERELAEARSEHAKTIGTLHADQAALSREKLRLEAALSENALASTIGEDEVAIPRDAWEWAYRAAGKMRGEVMGYITPEREVQLAESAISAFRLPSLPTPLSAIGQPSAIASPEPSIVLKDIKITGAP